jgi:hypothetical protein
MHRHNTAISGSAVRCSCCCCGNGSAELKGGWECGAFVRDLMMLDEVATGIVVYL